MVALTEKRHFHNVTLEFQVQLPASEKYLLQGHEVKIMEDQGIYLSKVKIVEKSFINEQTLKFTICVTNYDTHTFTNR